MSSCVDNNMTLLSPAAVGFCDKTMIAMLVPHNNVYLRLSTQYFLLKSGIYHMNSFSHEYILAICYSHGIDEYIKCATKYFDYIRMHNTGM